MNFKLNNTFAADVLVGDVILHQNYNSRGEDVYAKVVSVNIDVQGMYSIKMMYLDPRRDADDGFLVYEERHIHLLYSQFHRLTKFN